jgi:hypothetical protein
MKVTSDTYSFVDNDLAIDDAWHIKIKEGLFRDIVYKYGKIQIKENDISGEATLSFQYKIIDLPSHLVEDDLNGSTDFMTLIGDILTHIIEDSFETGKFKLGKNDQPTNSESTLHE